MRQETRDKRQEKAVDCKVVVLTYDSCVLTLRPEVVHGI